MWDGGRRERDTTNVQSSPGATFTKQGDKEGVSGGDGHQWCLSALLLLKQNTVAGAGQGGLSGRLFSLVVLEAGGPRSRYQQIQGPGS